MKHPHSSQVLTVINNFKEVLPMAKRRNHLSMDTPFVCGIGECGTIHCHGGWYAIAKGLLGEGNSFTDGANAMAEDLGLVDNKRLEDWAYDNKRIWGNRDGDLMFYGENAFYSRKKRPRGAKNLQDIIDHWTEVYERLLALENKEQKQDTDIGKSKPSIPHEYTDITSELAVFPEDKIEVDLVTEKINSNGIC